MEKSGVAEFLVSLLILAVGVAFLLNFWGNNLLVASFLLMMFLLVRRLWPRKNDFTFFVVGVVFGPLLEVFGIRYGVWTYANPTALGIPLWLPPAWGFTCVMLMRIAEAPAKIKER